MTKTTELITCDHDGCTASFAHVPARQFPNLCLDHAADADRDANGWNPGNSVD